MSSSGNKISATTLTALYKERFNREPDVIAAAPGRVNLVGEHTDYNEGLVMPMALDAYVAVAVGASSNGKHRLSSTLVSPIVELDPMDLEKPGDLFWTNYVRGVLISLERRGIKVPPIELLVDSTVPRGGGLSSSAALEVALISALTAFVKQELPSLEIARIGQQIEHEYMNIPCGIMDQFVAVYAEEKHVIMLDCASLKYEQIAFDDPELSVLVVDSSVKHSLGDGAYAQRRAQCEEAARILEARSLREVTLEDLEVAKHKLGDVFYRRARHVVGENARVEAFATAVKLRDWDEAGSIMRSSHASLRDDYEVSCPELEALVAACDTIPSASAIYGARVNGAGFGGCIVALVRSDVVEQVAGELIQSYLESTGMETTYLVPLPGHGVRLLK